MSFIRVEMVLDKVDLSQIRIFFSLAFIFSLAASPDFTMDGSDPANLVDID